MPVADVPSPKSHTTSDPSDAEASKTMVPSIVDRSVKFSSAVGSNVNTKSLFHFANRVMSVVIGVKKSKGVENVLFVYRP